MGGDGRVHPHVSRRRASASRRLASGWPERSGGIRRAAAFALSLSFQNSSHNQIVPRYKAAIAASAASDVMRPFAPSLGPASIVDSHLPEVGMK